MLEKYTTPFILHKNTTKIAFFAFHKHVLSFHNNNNISWYYLIIKKDSQLKLFIAKTKKITLRDATHGIHKIKHIISCDVIFSHLHRAA